MDTVNIEPENNYKYKIKAVNGFDYAISDASNIVNTPLSDSLRVIRDIIVLTFDVIKLKNSIENNITSDLNLSKVGKNGSIMLWSSTSELINVETGEVNRTALNSDLNVTLEALLKYGDSNDTVIFELVIKKIDIVDTDKDGIPDDVDLDDDNDGISDIDELRYGLDPLNKDDAIQDADEDGFTNIDEINAGTNPRDGTSIPTIETGLQLHLEFENNTNDSSNSSNHGVEYGGVQYSVGVRGQAAYFDGVDDYVRVANRENINFKANEDFTISVWMLPHKNQLAPTGDNDVLEKWSGGADNYPYVIRYYNQSQNIVSAQYDYNKTENKNPAMHSPKVSNIVYNHIVFKKKSNRLYLYQDGVLLQTKDIDLNSTASSSDLFIAVRGNMINQFRGYIDELRIYNRALNEAQIIELYNQADTDALTDSDGDGYLDSEEIGDINNPRNTDGTDEIDALDTDSDNDGVSD